MTLQEVFNQIPAAAWSKRVPSVIKLAEEGTPVLTDAMDKDTSVTIYSNGYVVYQCGDRATVFPLHECRDYVYVTVEETNVIPFSTFADQPWQVRVFMEGKDRLVHNHNNRKEGRTVSLDASDHSDCWEAMSDMGSGDPLRILAEREKMREEAEMIRKNFAKLIKRQREILILCVVQGKTHVEAAMELGTTRQAVSDNLKRSICRLRRMYGLDEGIGGRNCFCRMGK